MAKIPSRRNYIKDMNILCSSTDNFYHSTYEGFATTIEANVPCYLEITLGSPAKFRDKQRPVKPGYLTYPAPFFVVNNTTASKTNPHIGQLVDIDRIDWNHVRGWMSACSHSAGSSFQSSMPASTQTPPSLQLRVIDLENACIVLPRDSAPYTALSYQWGMDQRLKLKNGNEILETPGFSNTTEGRPSRTICDAMTATMQLWYRYLWVDALCIVQDNAKDIQQNVNNMDQVYLDAQLTIVAAAGTDANHGPPGVAEAVPRTEHQIKTAIDGIIVANILGATNSTIAHSRWNTRAWTFQERLLSHRLLIFTECNEGCNFQEQNQTPVDETQYAHVPFDPQAFLDFECWNIWELYAIAVAEYTKRSMSDPNDKLRAFNGLMTFLEQPFRAPFVSGLTASLFDLGLLWRPIGSCEHSNLEFPGWPWAGWDGSVIYDATNSMANKAECTISQAHICTQSGNVCLCSGMTTEKDVPSMNYDSRSWQRKYDEESNEIHYEMTDPNYQEFRYPRPLRPLTDSERTNFSLCKSAIVLTISAKVARFRLTNEHSPVFRLGSGSSRENCTQGHHDLCYLAVLDEQGRRAGTIVVDGREIFQTPGQLYNFMGLSRSTLSQIDLDPSWDESSTSFRHWTQQHHVSEVDDVDDDDQSKDDSEGAHFSAEYFDTDHFDEDVF